MNANQRIPWPWNVPRFTAMWNQTFTQITVNNDATNSSIPRPRAPLYRYSLANIARSANLYARRGSHTYRLPSTQTRPASEQSLADGNVTHQPACEHYHSQTPSHTQVSGTIPSLIPGLTSEAVNLAKRSGKRLREISESDEIIPTSSKPRMSSPARHENTTTTTDKCDPNTSSEVPVENKVSGDRVQQRDESDVNRNYQDDYNVRSMDLCSSDDGHIETNVQGTKSNDGEQSGGFPTENTDIFKREWILTGLGREKEKRPLRGLEFSVLSYNLLAQGLLDTNMDLYDECPRDILDWNYRKQNLFREMKDLNPDIMCLQEIEEDPFNNFFQPQLAILGYDGVFKKRTGDKQDGCAIFYKNSVFQLVKHKLVEFYRQDVFPLDRDNVGTIVLLQPKNKKVANQKVCVATTHLLFNPKRGDVKLAQLGILFAEIDDIACRKVVHGEVKYHPVILCSDLNSEPYSPLYKFINKGRLSYDSLCKTTVSGQHKGPHWGYLPQPLWSPKMGVTDQCQYVSKVEERNRKKSPAKKDDQEGRGEQRSENWDANEEWRIVTPRGHRYGVENTIQHSYHFKSVYKHRTVDNQYEVTSNHQRTNCTVDYIFYSVRGNTRDKDYGYPRHHFERPEGKLKLLARLSLFSDMEATRMGGLPNRRVSSDHFSLMAKFLIERD